MTQFPYEPVSPPMAAPAPLAPTLMSSPASRLNWLDMLLIGGGLLLGLLLVMPLTGRLLDPFINQEQDPALEEVLNLTEFTAFYSFAFLLIGLVLLLRGRSWGDVGLRAVSWQWLVAAVGLGVVFIPIRLMLVLVVALLTGLSTTDPMLAEESSSNPSFSLWYLVGLVEIFLLIVLFAPVVEELIFRGVLHSWLGRVVGLLAIPLSGVLFGLAHLAPLLVISNVVLGLVLSSSYHFSGSLWVPLTLHFVNNAIVGMFLAALLVFVALAGA